MSDIEKYLNPFTIAVDAAIVALEWYDEPAPHEEDLYMISSMNRLANDLELLDRPYRAEASRAVATPAYHKNGEPTSYYEYIDVAFNGIFICYERTIIARRNGGIGMNAFCASFKNVTFEPSGSVLPKPLVFAVPVLAAKGVRLLA